MSEENVNSEEQKKTVKNKPFNMQKTAGEDKPESVANTGGNEEKKIPVSSALIRRNRGK